MRRMRYCFVIAMLSVVFLSTQAHAILINRGTDTLGNRLIYDQGLDITWYDYTNAPNIKAGQGAWAGGLIVTHNGNTYDDWRLPATADGPYVYGYDGTTSAGFNITSSEMGHLFYIGLENLGYYETSGSGPQPGWGLNNTGDFQNLIASRYWSCTWYSNNNSNGWVFQFYYGNQGVDSEYDHFYALAVRDGDVAASISVPEPTTVALLGIGLAGLTGVAVRRRWKERSN